MKTEKLEAKMKISVQQLLIWNCTLCCILPHISWDKTCYTHDALPLHCKSENNHSMHCPKGNRFSEI